MKKIICLVLIFAMMLTACSKWKVEIVELTEQSKIESEKLPEEKEPEIPVNSEIESEKQQGKVSETEHDFHERMEYEDFFTALVEIKGGILLDVQKNIADFVSENRDYLKSEHSIELSDVPAILSTDDFSIRKTYEQEGKITYYAAVPVKNNCEIRVEIIETPKEEEKIWEIGKVIVKSLYDEDLKYYDWEVSDIDVPKSFPTSIHMGTWKSDNTDWFGQENPFEQKYGNFDHLECRNWTNFDEYIEASFAVPDACSPNIERAYGQINMTVPERIFFEGSIIYWDGNFGNKSFWDDIPRFKIGEIYFFGDWKEIEALDFSDKIESKKIGLENIKITDKYIRTFGDIYSSGIVETVDYHVNLGEGYGAALYFYVSESLTEEDIKIYDRIVESMVFVDMR